MCYRLPLAVDRPRCVEGGPRGDDCRLLTDGGSPEEGEIPEDEETAEEEEIPEGEGGDEDSGEEADDDRRRRSNVDVLEPGEAEPADPKWDPPDIDDIPEFEVRADDPVVESGAVDPGSESDGGSGTGRTDPVAGSEAGPGADPTAGRPHDARAPGATAVSSQGTEAYVAALELCARLPEDVRLPGEAADLVPAAVEAELEEDIQGFAAAEFDNPRPHVDTLAFEEVDDEIWLRIRIGVPTGGFADLDPEEIRSYALQRLEGVL